MMRALPLVLWVVLPWALILGACGEGDSPVNALDGRGDRGLKAPRLSGTGSDVAAREPRHPEPPTHELPFPDEPVGGIDVRVVGADGTPIEDATVIDLRRTQVTNRDGRASVGPFRGGHGMPSQCRHERTITVHVDGFEPVTHVCESGGGGSEVVRILDRGSVLAGRCVDSGGRSVAGVTLRVEYEQGPDARIESDAAGRFRLAGAARREGRLRIRENGWTCRPLAVVPPQEAIELVVYRTAWIHGRFDGTYERGRGFRPYLYVDTDQGWGGRLRHDRSFSIPCCPGEVVLRWDDVVLGRFVLEEGGVIEDVVIPVDITSRHDDGSGAEHPWVELDVSALGRRETFVAAYYEDLGMHRLGFIEDKEVERVRLRSKALRWLSVEPGSGAWRVLARAGQRVRIERPALARVTFRLLDPRGNPIREGWGEVRWTGTRHAAGHAYCGRAAEPSPPGERPGEAPAGLGVFRSGPMGAGVFDLAWRLGHDREARLLRSGVPMPDPPVPLDLGDIRIPEAAVLRVLVTTHGGAVVPEAVVRLAGRGRHVAARADRDGLASLVLTDPTCLVVEAEGPDGRTGRVRVAAGDVEDLVTLRLDRERR